MIRQMEIAAWLSASAVEFALLMVILRRGTFRRLPLFSGYIALDWLRGFALLLIWLAGTRGDYSKFFIVTEPMGMLLLFVAGVEAHGALTHTRPGLLVYVVTVACLGIGGMLMTPPGVHLPYERMFLYRTLTAFLLWTALLVTSVWHGRWNLHATVFLLYCMADMTLYWSILLAAPRWTAETFGMVSQGMCFVAWVWWVRRHAV